MFSKLFTTPLALAAAAALAAEALCFVEGTIFTWELVLFSPKREYVIISRREGTFKVTRVMLVKAFLDSGLSYPDSVSGPQSKTFMLLFTV